MFYIVKVKMTCVVASNIEFILCIKYKYFQLVFTGYVMKIIGKNLFIYLTNVEVDNWLKKLPVQNYIYDFIFVNHFMLEYR